MIFFWNVFCQKMREKCFENGKLLFSPSLIVQLILYATKFWELNADFLYNSFVIGCFDN